MNAFQLTASRGGRPGAPATKTVELAFQLTASRGGRLCRFCLCSANRNLSTHGLTRRPTFMVLLILWQMESFNSRPHEEADHSCSPFSSSGLSFQLTASRGGRPIVQLIIQIGIRLSTHGLTRRPTNSATQATMGKPLSTHGLTRRPTGLLKNFHNLV